MRHTLTLLCLAALPAWGQQTLTPDQMRAAEEVYQGDAACDMNQHVHVQAVEGEPGTFELTHAKMRYRLVPEVTSTGAIRLEDRQAGVVWLQIPAKSMLLNAKAGRRELDGCRHAEQVAESVNPQAPSLGIAVN